MYVWVCTTTDHTVDINAAQTEAAVADSTTIVRTAVALRDSIAASRAHPLLLVVVDHAHVPIKALVDAHPGCVVAISLAHVWP